MESSPEKDTVCQFCDKVCKNERGKQIHESACSENPENMGEKPYFEFSNRFKNSMLDRCPKCNEGFKSYLILDELDWICLNCGCHFAPKSVLEEARNALQKVKWDDKTQDSYKVVNE